MKKGEGPADLPPFLILWPGPPQRPDMIRSTSCRTVGMKPLE